MSRSSVRIGSVAPRRRKRHIACGDFFTKVTAHSFCCVSSFAKGHACCGYALVNAGIMPPLRYQPFASMPAAQITKLFTLPRSERTWFRSDFCLHENQSHAPSFLLYRKKEHSATCSVVNAFTTARCRYYLFASMRLRRTKIYIVQYSHVTTGFAVIKMLLFEWVFFVHPLAAPLLQ